MWVSLVKICCLHPPSELLISLSSCTGKYAGFVGGIMFMGRIFGRYYPPPLDAESAISFLIVTYGVWCRISLEESQL